MMRRAGIGVPVAQVHDLHRRSESNHVLAVRIYSSHEAAPRGLVYFWRSPGPESGSHPGRSSSQAESARIAEGASFVICSHAVGR